MLQESYENPSEKRVQRGAAVVVADGWYRNGVPTGRTRKVRPTSIAFGIDSIRSAIRKAKLEPDDAEKIVRIQLVNVSQADLKAHLLRLRSEGLAPATLNKALSAVGAPLAWAARNKIISTNPAEGIPHFSGQSRKRDILSKDEIHALGTLGWPDERARVAFLVALTTGARLGEVNALQLRDIGDDRLFIRHSWGAADGLKSTKNREEREVWLAGLRWIGEGLRTRNVRKKEVGEFFDLFDGVLIQTIP